MSGKWSEAGVPKKGWSCVGTVDLGSPEQVCEMCDRQEIRHVHIMEHPNYPAHLEVGSHCAEEMEEDYVTPKLRDQAMRNAAARRKTWLKRKWKRTINPLGSYLNTDGLLVKTFFGKNYWHALIIERATLREKRSKKEYDDENAAKMAAFDAIVFLQGRGWGKRAKKKEAVKNPPPHRNP